MKADIITILGTFISYFNNALIYLNVTNRKIKFKPLSIIVMLVLSVINALVMFKLPIVVRLVYNIICFGLSFYFSAKDNFKSILFYVLILWVFGSFVDIVLNSILLAVFKFVVDSLPELGVFIVSLFMQIALYMFFKIKKIKLLVIRIKDKLELIKNIVWVFLLMLFLAILFGIFAYKNHTSLSIEFFFLVLLSFSLLVSIFFLKILYEERTFKNTIENLLNNNKYYLENNIQNRIFRHNIVHQLNSIKSVADKKVNSLIDDLIKEYNLSDVSNKPTDILPNGINGIICRSIYNTKRKDVNYVINNYIRSNLFDILTPRKYNKLCEVLGICLDNALIATIKSKEKILQIVLLENSESVVIKIMNTFEDSLEIDKLGTINYTTNESGHGLGIYSLLGKKDVTINTKIINNLFENQIIIKKP